MNEMPSKKNYLLNFTAGANMHCMQQSLAAQSCSFDEAIRCFEQSQYKRAILFGSVDPHKKDVVNQQKVRECYQKLARKFWR